MINDGSHSDHRRVVLGINEMPIADELTERQMTIPIVVDQSNVQWSQRFRGALAVSVSAFARLRVGGYLGTRKIRKLILAEGVVGAVMIVALLYSLSQTVPALHFLLSGLM